MGIGRKNNSINKTIINDLESLFLGSVTPDSVPTGVGLAFWLATKNGIYANFGGVVVSSSSFALISRDANGNFSISETPLDLTTTKNFAGGINEIADAEDVKVLNDSKQQAISKVYNYSYKRT